MAWETAVRRPDHRAWLQSSLARSLRQAGETDMAALLAGLGRYGLALAALDGACPLADLQDEARVSHLILESECLLGLGLPAAAHDLLGQAFALCARPDLADLRTRAEALEQRF